MNSNDFDHCPVETFLLARAAVELISGLSARVLDLGCGPARTLYELWLKRPECLFYGLDRVRGRVEQGAEAMSRLGVPVCFQEAGQPLEDRPGEIVLVEGDLRRAGQWGSWEKAFDLILMNPPFYLPGQGRLPPDSARAVARHQVAGGLSDFFEAALWMLAPQGRVVAIYPSERERDFREELTKSPFQVDSCREFYHSPDSPIPSWIVFDLSESGKINREERKKPVWDLDRFLGYEIEEKN
jgi:tRNA1(Val) A37 N6-methylase TrmN6